MRIAWHQHALTQGERNTLLCLRCTYGFPNPILVYYNWLIGQFVRLSTRRLAYLFHSPTGLLVNLKTCQRVYLYVRQLVYLYVR